MCFSTQLPAAGPGSLLTESQRFFSQAVGACLARLQRTVDLLQEPLLSDAQSASLLCEIDRQTDRLNILMRQVLAAGNVGALAVDDPSEPVALRGMLNRLLAEYNHASPSHTLRLQLRAQPVTAGHAVPCLLLALQLLLDNAVRCTPPGQAIQVECEADNDGGWHFHVRDSGAGIAPDGLAAIFDSPHRAAPAPIYGLGLTLAQHLVHELGGRMWVVSQLGVGATFSFSLPRHVLPRRWTVSPPKVLLIEQNSESCASLQAGYEEAGFEVEVAPSVDAGLARVSDFAPNLVLLALSPTSLAGQACLATLRQSGEAAVIFLLAPHERSAVADALWQGASDCLVKPFHIRELIARTRAILRRRPPAGAIVTRAEARTRAAYLQRPKINPLLQ